VLDIAAGTGEPSITIAEIVGPTGSVTCTDAIADMVSAAKREAQRRKLTNISFRQCTADSLPFDDNSFDIVVSRLGAMFFPDPLAALREMFRVTKRNGTLALVVWDKSESNPFLHIVSTVIARYVETPAADPDALGAFRFAEHGKLAELLSQAGAVKARERPLDFRIEAPISLDQFWQLRSETSATLRKKLATLSPEGQVSVEQEVKEAALAFFTNGQMSFPAEMVLVAGTKPQ
jgi:SAM-dependent methyltransferase